MTQSKRQKVLAVVGPTGSGKTELAVLLAKKFNGILISADSRQVYRGLDVGTNKEGISGIWEGRPVRVIDDVRQLMIDVVEPGQPFTLHDWLTQVRYILEYLKPTEKLPIVVGGTGLYVTALLEGYQPGGGRFAKHNQPVEFQSLTIMPAVERVELYQRSDERFPGIFDRLKAEAEGLLSAGISSNWLEKIGLDYRYIIYYIQQQLSREEAIEQFQAASRAYIRRQLTWWRHHGEVRPVRGLSQAAPLVKDWLETV